MFVRPRFTAGTKSKSHDQIIDRMRKRTPLTSSSLNLNRDLRIDKNLVILQDNALLADKITDAHIEEFSHAFTMFDKDGDGSISTKELGTVMRSLGQNPTEKELREICNEVDVDGNGRLDFKEFILLMTTHFDTINAESELKTAFQVFDTKGKGWIDEAELRRYLTTIGDKLTSTEVDELLHEADSDHDGKINYLEFVKLMTQESLQVKNSSPKSTDTMGWKGHRHRM